LTLFYLASPYSRYPLGREHAFDRALDLTVRLMKAKVPVWSPIVYSHQFVAHGLPIEAEHWEFLDGPMTLACSGCLVYMLDGWTRSLGIAKELEWFKSLGKPVRYIEENETIDEILVKIHT
jgi:hypothetical protein